ncbi:hypothetical protein HDV00_010091, partial [Rhizophlyctis rosea]
MQFLKIVTAAFALIGSSALAAPPAPYVKPTPGKPTPPKPTPPTPPHPVVKSKLPTNFNWTATEPLIFPQNDTTHTMVSIKDPSIIHWNGKYHIYATGAYSSGANATDFKMIYTSFKSFEEIAKKPPKIHFMDEDPDFRIYGCAPQIFFYEPHKLWYLIFQSPNPTYSTSKNPADPKSWSKPKVMVDKLPPTPTALQGPNSWETWIDFFVICDDTHCHLYYSNDYGKWYRQETTRKNFPLG